MRFIHVQTVFADIFRLLRNTVRVPVARVKVLLREIAVFIQRFSVPERDLLSGLRVYTQFGISRKILSEIDNRTAVRRPEDFPLKTLLLYDRYALRLLQIPVSVIPYRHAVPVCDIFHPGIVYFALLQVIGPHRSVLARFPIRVTDQYRISADLKLAQQRQIRPVIIRQTVDTDRASVPSVTERYGDLIFSRHKQSGNVICLYGQSFVIVSRPRRQYKFTDAPSVDDSFIQTVTGNIEDRVGCISG